MGLIFRLTEERPWELSGNPAQAKRSLVSTLMGLIPMPPGKIEDGEALFEGNDLLKCFTEGV